MAQGDLTQRPSPQGSDETAALLRDLDAMQSALRGRVRSVSGASQTIVRSSGEIASGAVDLSSREESTGITQLGQAVHDLDPLTQQNAALVEQTAAAAATLREQADGLAAEVAHFRLA